jgi:hypothetical protein
MCAHCGCSSDDDICPFCGKECHELYSEFAMSNIKLPLKTSDQVSLFTYLIGHPKPLYAASSLRLTKDLYYSIIYAICVKTKNNGASKLNGVPVELISGTPRIDFTKTECEGKYQVRLIRLPNNATISI